MAPGRADYYLTAVARGDEGVEGYYLARGEEPGRWLGAGADTLGLSGEVTAEQLRAVLDGCDPTTGQQLAAHPARQVPGFDHTFRAPKSVSLLWALGDQATAAEVVASHDAAVNAAIGYLQRAAGCTAAGPAGRRRWRWMGSSRPRSGTGPHGRTIRCCTPRAGRQPRPHHR
jgi:conjugative relaxase-like TrwC/TraI family protein